VQRRAASMQQLTRVTIVLSEAEHVHAVPPPSPPLPPYPLQLAPAHTTWHFHAYRSAVVFQGDRLIASAPTASALTAALRGTGRRRLVRHCGGRANRSRHVLRRLRRRAARPKPPIRPLQPGRLGPPTARRFACAVSSAARVRRRPGGGACRIGHSRMLNGPSAHNDLALPPTHFQIRRS
jgi:hypothetical protein